MKTTTMLPIEKSISLEYKTTMANYEAVPVTAAFTINKFSADANIFQEMPERGIGKRKKNKKFEFRIYEYKYKRLFSLRAFNSG